MDLTLRGAFIISAIIHASIFAPFCNQHLIRQEIEKRNSVIVDYVVLKDIATAIATNKEVVIKTPETPRVEIKKEIKVEPPAPSREQIEANKKMEAMKLKEAERLKKEDAIKKAREESARKEKELKANKDYVNYYQLIREKIRARLKENYRYYGREGDVYLSFTVSSNGKLLAYNIDRAKSSTDEVLLHITAASLKAVSPFPRIPKTLSMPKISFSLLVSFKK